MNVLQLMFYLYCSINNTFFLTHGVLNLGGILRRGHKLQVSVADVGIETLSGGDRVVALVQVPRLDTRTSNDQKHSVTTKNHRTTVCAQKSRSQTLLQAQDRTVIVKQTYHSFFRTPNLITVRFVFAFSTFILKNCETRSFLLCHIHFHTANLVMNRQ